MQGKSPPVQIKENKKEGKDQESIPSGIFIWLHEGVHPATWRLQSTPAGNARKRVWQYIEKETNKTICMQPTIVECERYVSQNYRLNDTYNA